MLQPLNTELRQRLRALVGEAGWIDDAARLSPYLAEQRARFVSTADVVICPENTEQVAQVLALCHAARVAVIPQGGNTGLVGGSVAQAGQVIVNLRRMNRIRAIDARARVITADAGCLLAQVQHAAAEVGCLFPLSLAAEGSCQIGGNLATNAGGTNAVHYGVARDLALGLEVVLADGQIWQGLSQLKKDNTGYDLRNLMIGSEGTLGIITAATLKLFAVPADIQTAWLTVPDPARALAVLQRLQTASDQRVTACELMSAQSIDFVKQYLPSARLPVSARAPWHVLIEVAGGSHSGALKPVLEAALTAALEAGEIADAALAHSDAQRAQMWLLRKSIPAAQKPAGGSIKHDICVPLAQISAFIARASAAVTQLLPGARVCAFGHVGDGNLHFNISQPQGADRAAFLAQWEACNEVVHDITRALGGSIAAEHGIGRLKRDALPRYKSAAALAAMRAIKRALDPHGILNPGAVVPEDLE